MPIDQIMMLQKQGRLLEERLSKTLDSGNKLYQLRNIIDWNTLEERAMSNIDIKRFGRNRKSNRVMLGLMMLQAMCNGSDSFTESEIVENVYWQYFCGYEFWEKDLKISETSIRRFRHILGEAGANEIMKELMRVGIKIGMLKKKKTWNRQSLILLFK